MYVQVLFEVDHSSTPPEVLRLLPAGWANDAAILDKLNKVPSWIVDLSYTLPSPRKYCLHVNATAHTHIHLYISYT